MMKLTVGMLLGAGLLAAAATPADAKRFRTPAGGSSTAKSVPVSKPAVGPSAAGAPVARPAPAAQAGAPGGRSSVGILFVSTKPAERREPEPAQTGSTATGLGLTAAAGFGALAGSAAANAPDQAPAGPPPEARGFTVLSGPVGPGFQPVAPR